MPPKLCWTEARDTQIRRLRAEGATWDAIAHALLLSRFAVIERGRRIGARKLPAAPRVLPEDPERPPLPAGHPRSWGALIEGTLLEGTPYPLPWFP
jgi:hypothetical protein